VSRDFGKNRRSPEIGENHHGVRTRHPGRTGTVDWRFSEYPKNPQRLRQSETAAAARIFIPLTGVTGKTTLVRMGLEALIAKAAAERLAALGGSERRLHRIPCRRDR